MGNSFELMICNSGTLGGVFGGPTPCTIADINREETDFQHTVDFVVQGYSGSVDIPASSNVEVVDLGMGNESEDWDVASNGVGLVWLRDGEDGRLGRKATRS